ELDSFRSTPIGGPSSITDDPSSIHGSMTPACASLSAHAATVTTARTAIERRSTSTQMFDASAATFACLFTSVGGGQTLNAKHGPLSSRLDAGSSSLQKLMMIRAMRNDARAAVFFDVARLSHATRTLDAEFIRSG